MAAAPVRFLTAAAWPLTIWTSLTQLEKHPADDYVERTSPIVATAIAFWICAIALIVLANPVATLMGEEGALVLVRRTPTGVINVLWFFTPVIYLVGLWLYTARDEAYPR